jgi:Na+/H+ antiporter NhaD/arsenite permease-like protein
MHLFGDEYMKIMKKLWKKDPVLCISLLLAVLSMLAVPPGKAYVQYINYPMLIMLACLMTVVAGFKMAGVFTRLSCMLTRRCRSLRGLSIILVSLCFFTAMLVTNDVALLTFVPFTLELLRLADENALIFIIVMETVAANLGSMMTPIGNPQNLFLFSYYNMSLKDFFAAVVPIGVASYIIVMSAMAFIKNKQLSISWQGSGEKLRIKELVVFSMLFIICILTVLKVIDSRVCLGVVALCTMVVSPRLFKEVDYGLLATFICFFIFVGNIGSLKEVSWQVARLLAGRELITSALICQGISNVPAAIMLSGFTENACAVLRGVNIGGLGTLVASLASLISFKLYNKSQDSRPGRYIGAFTVINITVLAVLLIIASILKNQAAGPIGWHA